MIITINLNHYCKFYELNAFHLLIIGFSSKIKSIMTTKGMSLLARGSKGNWELLAEIRVVGKRIPKHSGFALVFGNTLSYYSDFGQ